MWACPGTGSTARSPASLEILGDRWTLLIVRDLLVGARRFNELAPRACPACRARSCPSGSTSSSVHGLVERDRRRLRADPGLRGAPARSSSGWPSGARAGRSASRGHDELDPTVLMWWIRGGIDPERVRRAPRRAARACSRRAAAPGSGSSSHPHDVSLCFTDPGHDVDVTIESLARRRSTRCGRAGSSSGTAVRDGLVELTGQRDVVLRLPQALLFSPVAPYVRRAAARV